jgi:hypothetical protein
MVFIHLKTSLELDLDSCCLCFYFLVKIFIVTHNIITYRSVILGCAHFLKLMFADGPLF